MIFRARTAPFAPLKDITRRRAKPQECKPDILLGRERRESPTQKREGIRHQSRIAYARESSCDIEKDDIIRETCDKRLLCHPNPSGHEDVFMTETIAESARH